MEGFIRDKSQFHHQHNKLQKEEEGWKEVWKKTLDSVVKRAVRDTIIWISVKISEELQRGGGKETAAGGDDGEEVGEEEGEGKEYCTVGEPTVVILKTAAGDTENFFLHLSLFGVGDDRHCGCKVDRVRDAGYRGYLQLKCHGHLL